MTLRAVSLSQFCLAVVTPTSRAGTTANRCEFGTQEARKLHPGKPRRRSRCVTASFILLPFLQWRPRPANTIFICRFNASTI
jgi:hypothetical protein